MIHCFACILPTGEQATKISPPAAPGSLRRKLGNYLGGEAREKKSVGFVDEGGKASRGAEVKYIDIVLFSVLISALHVQESDGIVAL